MLILSMNLSAPIPTHILKLWWIIILIQYDECNRLFHHIVLLRFAIGIHAISDRYQKCQAIRLLAIQWLNQCYISRNRIHAEMIGAYGAKCDIALLRIGAL